MSIIIKTQAQIDLMRISCKLAAEVLDYIEPYVKPGITTLELDKLCHNYIVNVQSAYPSPLNYQPNPKGPAYPNSICTSVNAEICHGIPNDKPLKNGDIVNLDITVYKNGFHGDTSRTYLVGDKVTPQAKRLVQVTYECMWLGIKQVKPGNFLGDIGHAIQTHAEKNAYSVVQEFCGHGIGEGFHEDPQVLHYGKAKTGPQLQSGMIFTIEPMINQGKRTVRFSSNGWTALTKDRSLSAQFEHTILVTPDGYEVLTISPNMPAIPDFMK
ncbi:MAG: type I methionyl aminopeptidase [Burkholderiales bacterium]|nr:type I methionyl aminopeptidase [Burkholderiales bacterium]